MLFYIYNAYSKYIDHSLPLDGLLTPHTLLGVSDWSF